MNVLRRYLEVRPPKFLIFLMLGGLTSKNSLMNILRLFLLPLSLIYFLILQIIYFLYRIGLLKRFHPGCPVISIGNITVGGTGKTPIVELVSNYFQNIGKKAVVLIRGYGRDESPLLKKKLDGIPVLVGRDRIKNSQMAEKELGAQVIILDDGFQHWRLKRDFDIVVIDSTRPFGNGMLLPAGILREPIQELKRADAFFLTRTDQVDKETLGKTLNKLKKIRPNALIVESMHRPLYFYRLNNPKERIALDEFIGKEAVLLSSIGNPESFEATIESLGVRVQRHFQFLDHYWYRDRDICKVSDFCRFKEISIVITTEKDMVKLTGSWKVEAGRWKPEIFVLAIKIEILKNEERLLDRLNRVCSG